VARDSLTVENSKDGGGLGGSSASGCASCGTRLAPSQRYCLECGARRGPLPAAVANWLSIVPPALAEGSSPDGAAAEDGVAEDLIPATRYMPAPRTAAVAVMSLLAFGVLLGGLTGPAAQSAGIAPIVLYTAAEPAPASTPPVEAAPASVPAEAAPAVVSTAPEATLPVAPEPLVAPPARAPKPKAPLELPEAPTLPPIQHVFLIVLGDNSFESAYGEASPAPYLAKTLRAKGELLSNYYAVTQGDLANEIALISGQGPTVETAANCPNYADISPATVGTAEQVAGAGCVYPAATQTLPGQLAAGGKKWKAYTEGIGAATAQPAACPHPALGSADANQAPLPGNPYVTWRNPFVYFHSLADGPECGESDVGLEQLAVDLKAKAGVPALSYIVPNACHDGGEVPCEPGQPAGLAAAEPFLQTAVPEIEASAAYKEEGGLIAITFAQAPHTEASTDSSACCATPEYPNLPVPAAPPSAPPASGPVKPTGGGGRVGMLLISPYVEPGSLNEAGYYNHFSLLLSIEELFGLPPLGYAAEPALTAFDSSVFNAEPTASPEPKTSDGLVKKQGQLARLGKQGSVGAP
jgi:hypothetical protein